jgi:hypothetical protein
LAAPILFAYVILDGHGMNGMKLNTRKLKMTGRPESQTAGTPRKTGTTGIAGTPGIT